MRPHPDERARAHGPKDAFVTVQERYGAPQFPQRPEIHWFGFRDAGRGFHVLVAIGSDAPPERRAEAVDLLDSLRFEPAPEGASRS